MITISPGHYKVGSGAKGLIDEVAEARKVVATVKEHLIKSGVACHVVVDNVSNSQKENLRYLIAKHNATKRELDVSVHFNAISGQTNSALGVEVLYINDKLKPLAQKMSEGIAHAGMLKNRGAKKRTDLAFLKGVHKPAILIEVCFVNSTVDVSLYKKYYSEICLAIANVLKSYFSTSNTVQKSNYFSMPALEDRVMYYFGQKKLVESYLKKGIEIGAFQQVWLKKYEQNTLKITDFCALILLLYFRVEKNVKM